MQILGASLRIGAGTAARGDAGRAAAAPRGATPAAVAPDLSESGAQPAIDASDTRPPPAVRTGRTTSNHAITEPTLSQHEAEALRRDDARRAPRPTRQGSFGEASVFRLLHRLHIRKASGRLRLQADGLTKDLYFAAGELRTVDSDDPADDLLALLRESDTISLHEAEAAAARARAEGLSDGEALVALGGVAASRLFQFLQMQLSEKLLSCLFWEEGAWSWWAGAEFVPDPFAIEVSIGDLLLRGVAERAETRYFRRFYRPHRAALLEQRRSGDELRGLSLSSRAMRVVASLAEAPTLPEIVHLFCDRYRWPEGDVYRTVFLLTEQDVVRFAGESDAGLP
ncbi:MAG: DUF4388 domain-containing protein [Myxococcales bacterium]|nr:DUF4388 domain-containing protein [Myxococcales bacterium]